MGNECTMEEREIRNRTFHDSIYSIENEIKNELDKKDTAKKDYSPYYLINQDLCKKCPFLLNQTFNQEEAKNQFFEFKDLIKNKEKIDCSYIDKSLNFDFPSDFIFINENFMKIINQYAGKTKKEIFKKYETIIGGGCIIIKSSGGHINILDKKPYRFIILYNEIKDNTGNKVNFLLYIKDKKIRRDAVNYILENSLWKYFEKINYKIKDDYAKIFDEKNKEIGYLIRTSNSEEIESFFQKYSNINMNNNFNNNMQQFNQNSNNNFIGNNNNINFMMNNQNINNINFNDNQMNLNIAQNQEDEKNLIFVTFTFSNGNQIYIDVNKNQTFLNTITQLEYKYEYIKNINKKKFFFNNKIIKDYNKTLSQLKIEDSSNIIITQ